MVMKWYKHGLVFCPERKFDWAVSHALQPTPLLLADRIRIFFGSRDADGISRIGWVDLKKDDPKTVLGYSLDPVLDIGEDGCFDENGVVPSAVVQHDGRVYMYYAGYQLGTKVRFSVLGGLAVSEDLGQTFKRWKRVPVFERTDTETLFRVPHSVIYSGGVWKVWYGGGDRFINGAGKTLPVYNVRYTESGVPDSFTQPGQIFLETSGEEYRIGRPFLFSRSSADHYLFYGYSTEQAPYKLGYARSVDMKTWTRHDDEIGLHVESDGWASEMLAYPCVIRIDNRVYMFYNGRRYGEEGFGLAELIEW